ncbi:MAG: site-specific integrase [Cyanobacteria bacterium J06638_7]
MAAVDAELAAHNGRLAAIGIALKIERRGARLGLRGPLPCRRGGVGRQVQRLSLGLPASASGLEQAQRWQRQVLRELEQGSFRWECWSLPPERGRPASAEARPAALPHGPGRDLASLVDDFGRAFAADPKRRRNAAGSRSTWTAAYRPYLRRLLDLAASGPAGAGDLGTGGRGAGEGGALSRQLQQVLESYEPGSSSRQQCGVALAALARHGGLELPADWHTRAGGYGLHAARFRQLPSDQLILQLLELIPNPAWRLAYGLMATYGLRNHEVFCCDLAALGRGGDRVIRVLPTSKTGEHQVWPFQPGWVEHFGLERLAAEKAALPAVATDLRRTTLQQMGRRVAEQFRRYRLPITPYDLRHAWAVRTIHIGLPDTVAARMMGHSVAIHTRTYHHWITRRDQQQAVDAALARRPAESRGAA